MPLLSERGACGVKFGLRKEREAVDPGHGASLETVESSASTCTVLRPSKLCL